MPIYEYKCDNCGYEFEEIRAEKDKDIPCDMYCPGCEEEGFVRRLISAGSFKINGYSAANGYSKKK
jgi:putative FmdB family regulatory protein